MKNRKLHPEIANSFLNGTSWDIVYFPLGAAAFGGAERSLLELAAAQQARGLRVLVCYEPALKNGDFISAATAKSLPLHCVDWSPEHSLIAVARAAWNLFRRLDTRLIHFNISWRRHMWLVPLLARTAKGTRLLGSMRAIPDRYDNIPRGRYFGFIPGLRLWILPDLFIGRAWARSLHITVSVNRDDFPPRLIREFGFSPNRLRVIYNGVPIPDRMPNAMDRQFAKARLGYSAETILVAYVGRISQEKGIQYAIDAIAACDPRVHLVVAGEGDQLDELKAHVDSIGLTSRVRFIGYINDPFSIFSAAEIVVVPSLWNEAFGRVVVEAMACGAAVIATAVGGMQELFSDGKEGILVRKADAPAIASAINRLCNDQDFLMRLSLAGRQLAEMRYATQRVAADYGAIYSEMLEKKFT
ncbi:MAG TPA: glycosyltransferase family 4 protein [Azonexus sp.]|nr:glycosyltransferase family 4 protein [Azonexus sp.]